MQKNVASQKIELFAFDTTTGAAKTGDAANITAYVAKDHGTVTVLGDTSATEMDSTNAKGWYLFDLTQAETNADHLLFTGKSSTSNISIVGRPIETTPANFAVFSVDSSGRVDVAKIKGTTSAGTAGYVGIDWAAVLNPDSIVSLSATTVATVTALTGKTGFSLATSQTFNNTGTWTGNIVGTVSTCTTNTDMITAAQVRSAVGLSNANLDTQLAAIAGYIDTEVGSIVTLVTALPSAATIATAVWAKDLSAPATAGTAADYIKDAAAMTDQFFTMTELNAGNYRFTTAALGNVTINASSLVGASITLVGPVVANGGVEIIQGNDYTSTIGNALTWTFTGMPTIPADATVLLRATLGDTTFTKAGARVSATALKVEIDGTLTTATLLPVGTYRMQVDVTSATWGAGKKVSYVDAGMLVKRKV